MKLASPEQMKEIERRAIHEMGIPGVVLMENAAAAVVHEVTKELSALRDKKILVFAGKGNNGGDAFAAARHLYNRGAQVRVFLLAGKGEVSGDAKINLTIAENMGIDIVELLEEQQLESAVMGLSAADLVVDGIFGTGLKRDVAGLDRKVIDGINASNKTVISIDIPSGICGETGKVLGAGIKAAKTVTFCLPKTGLVVHPGCEYAGVLAVAGIGIPQKGIDSLGITASVTDRDYVSKHIPVRKQESNKGTYGRVFVVSGSPGMTGAGCLCAGAALRTGAGLVYLGVPSSLAPIFDAAVLEAVAIPLEEDRGYLSRKASDRILEKMRDATVAAVGPGLSVNGDIRHIVKRIVEEGERPVILDADALNALADNVSVLKKLKAPCIITPHPGEMARLTGKSVREVQENRLETARSFSAQWGAITVLKGSRTVIAAPTGEVFVNTTGNPGMATGGTGDVLTGMIAGLAAQGVKPLEAAVCGVYLHGLAGDAAAEIKGEHGLIAGDLLDEIACVMKEMTAEGKRG